MHLLALLSLEIWVDVGCDLRIKELYDATWNQFDEIAGFKFE